jgi:hypothetical protein
MRASHRPLCGNISHADRSARIGHEPVNECAEIGLASVHEPVKYPKSRRVMGSPLHGTALGAARRLNDEDDGGSCGFDEPLRFVPSVPGDLLLKLVWTAPGRVLRIDGCRARGF